MPPAESPPTIFRRERALLELAADLIADRIAGVIPVAASTTEYDHAEPQPYEQIIAPGQPAPGSDVVYRVAGGAAMWPLSVFAHLTTSAVVLERQLAIEYRDGTGQRYVVAGDPVTVSASEAQDFVWFAEAGHPLHPIAGAIVSTLSQQHLWDGAQLAIRLYNGDAGDQLSQVRISARFDPRPA